MGSHRFLLLTLHSPLLLLGILSLRILSGFSPGSLVLPLGSVAPFYLGYSPIEFWDSLSGYVPPWDSLSGFLGL